MKVAEEEAAMKVAEEEAAAVKAEQEEAAAVKAEAEEEAAAAATRAAAENRRKRTVTKPTPVGFARIVALYNRSPSVHQIH